MTPQLSLLERLWSFILRPTLTMPIPKPGFWLSLWDSLRLFCFFSLFSILGIVVNVLVSPLFGDGLENQVTNFLIQTQGDRWLSLIFLFVFLVVLAPVMEEIAFRQWLLPTRWNLALGLTFLLSYVDNLISGFSPQLNLTNFLGWIFDLVFRIFNNTEELVKVTVRISNNTEELVKVTAEILSILRMMFIFFGYIGIFLLIFLTLYFTLRLKDEWYLAIQNWFRRYFGVLFYFSAVFFGLVHISNYTNIQQFWWLTPLLVLPQLFGGIELGYVRTQYGLMWAMFNHALNNFIPFVAMACVLFLPPAFLQGKVDLSEVQLTDNDTLVLAFLGLFFLVLLVVVVVVNIFTFVELVLSRRRLAQLQANPVNLINPTNPTNPTNPVNSETPKPQV